MNSNRIVTLVVFLVGAAVAAGLFWFQQIESNYDRYIVGNVMALLWLPMLSILFVFREEPSKFGFALGNWKRVWVPLILMFAALCVVMAIVSRWPAYQNYYPIFRRFRYPVEFSNIFGGNPWQSAPWLAVYAFASYGLYMFCWEFFFRGYLLFGLQRSIGWWAVLVQAIAFGILHYGKPTSEFYASFGAGIILGIIAVNAKSFVPCFVLHWVASLTLDVIVIASRPTH